MDPNQQPHPSSLPSGAAFTSDFFGSFIDNSNSDLSHNTSHNTSVVGSQPPPVLQCSVNQEKMKEFHSRNLIGLSITLLRRSAIYHWLCEKDRLKRMQEQTPHRVAKAILKVFYSLAVKLQVKYSFAFRKLHRLNQQAKANNPPLQNIQLMASRDPLPVVNSKLEATAHVDKSKANAEKIRGAKALVQAAQQIYGKIGILHYRGAFDALLQPSIRTSSIQTMGRIVNGINLQLLQGGWTSLGWWLGFLQRIQILCETVSLILHLRMRQAFLSLSVQRPSLQCNDISTIQEPRSRKDSFKMNNSTQSITLQKELLDQFSSPNETAIQRQQSRAKRDPQQLDRNDPRLLKFSKDVKRKTVPAQNSLPEPQEQQSQLANQQSSHLMGGQGWQGKQTEELSMLRRHSATMNTSLCHSKSMIKKTRYPLEIAPERSFRVQTALVDDSLPGVLNQGRKMKHFQDSSRIFKPKAIKHEQLRRQFADFNDLFTLREVLAFVQSIRTTGTEQKRGISLARIKQKVNHKTQEEYNSKIKIRTERQDKSREECTPVIYSQKQIEHPHHHNHSLSRGHLEQTFASVRMNTSHSRSRQDSRDRSRKAEFRIPSQIPKNLDYYVDKSLKKEPKVQKSTLRLSAIDADGKRRTPCSSSRKKLQFNVVKAGSTRISADVDRRRGGDTERRSIPKIQITKRNKEVRQVREAQPPASNCEYFMTFRDPPKKKMKKGILKNDI